MLKAEGRFSKENLHKSKKPSKLYQNEELIVIREKAARSISRGKGHLAHGQRNKDDGKVYAAKLKDNQGIAGNG